MLPSRAYSRSLPAVPASTPLPVPAPDHTLPVLLLAADAADYHKFSPGQFTSLPACTTDQALQIIRRVRPNIAAIDWDLPDLDAAAVCTVACQDAQVRVLAMMTDPARAPAALKAGSHAILLKPFVPSLVAARLGRLLRAAPAAPADSIGTSPVSGTNRQWPATACPACRTSGAVSFEFSSYRRSWYACLGCDAVWLGRRQE